MVSDERREQLNYAYFSNQVDRSRRVYTDATPSFQQRLVRHRADRVVATLSHLLAPGARVLDVGCGTGEVGGRLVNAGFEVTGVDLIPGMVEVGRQACPGASWVVAPFGDRAGLKREFDAVVALGYLEYQERAGKELTRMGRLMNPGALLILSVPNTLSSQFGFGAQRILYRVGHEPESVAIRHTFTPERLQRLLGMAGFILMDYVGLRPESKPEALGIERPRLFWSHRISHRLCPEILALARTYRVGETGISK